MEIKGIQKVTLLDYPGKVACTVFTGGCNFRCPFCQNSDLVISPALTPTIAGEEIFGFLRKRRGLLDAICISGGEPLLQPDIAEFIMRCREMGYLVKLDTNGSFPDLLQRLIDAKLLNYIAMDIKTAPERYSVLTGVRNIDIGPVLASVDIIRNSGVEHEFRTPISSASVSGLKAKNVISFNCLSIPVHSSAPDFPLQAKGKCANTFQSFKNIFQPQNCAEYKRRLLFFSGYSMHQFVLTCLQLRDILYAEFMILRINIGGY